MNHIRNFFLKETDSDRPVSQRMRFWVFRVRSATTTSFVTIERQTADEAFDNLPTHDTFYTVDQLTGMKYRVSRGLKTIKQTWTDRHGKRMYLDFHFVDSFNSARQARDCIQKETTK